MAAGGGVHERGQVQHHILPVRWLWGVGGERRAFSSEGPRRNADHRSEELGYSECVSPSCPWLGWEGICQVKTAANNFGGAWNTDKESQVLRMRADLDSGNCAALVRGQETPRLSFYARSPRPHPLSIS